MHDEAQCCTTNLISDRYLAGTEAGLYRALVT